MIITLAYLLAAWRCWLVAKECVAPKGTGPRLRRTAQASRYFWYGIAGFMLLMASERQLGLLMLITDQARSKAQQLGLYHERDDMQEQLAALLSLLGLAVVAPAAYAARRRGWWAIVAIVGVVALAAFVLIRALSWHVIDEQLGTSILGVSVNLVLELALIGWIAFAALGAGRQIRAEFRFARLRALVLKQRKRRERAEAAAAALGEA